MCMTYMGPDDKWIFTNLAAIIVFLTIFYHVKCHVKQLILHN